MAAPSYTEDLTDITEAESTTNWSESTDANWDDGGNATADADYAFIQNTLSISQTATKATICSLFYNNGSGITIPTDGAFFVWQNWSSPNAMDTLANGGMRVMVGSSTADFKSWDVGGRDFGRYPYGGWMNHAVNPTLTADDTVGTPGATQQYIGAAIKVTTAIGKGNPHQVDAMRYGRGSSIFEFGETANYCVFSGFAAANDATTARWGLIQAIAGGYLWKGKMTLGTSTNACDFRDSNVNIVIDDTRKVTANFNTIEVNNASSRVDWTNVIITALGTVSPGRLVCNANADLNWSNCQFVGMGSFTFGGSASACLDSVFRNCGQIDPNGGDLSGTQILTPTVAADDSALVWNVAGSPSTLLDGVLFTKGTNAHHAIKFGTSAPTTFTLTNITFSGFNVSDGQNDSTLVFEDRGSNTTWNVTIDGGTTPSYKKRRSGDTVNIITGSVTVTLTGLVSGSEVRVYDTSSGAVVDGVESSGTSFAFSYTAAEVVYIRIFHLSYLPADIIDYTIPATNTSVPVQQVFDRNYSNP